ncbi:MAG: glycosyltransferase family 39 protein, partial [Candidatus Solibacter sp.]|nr:glycosyltransferase family 39 protein [Candidatus Solibacter sp.]
ETQHPPLTRAMIALLPYLSGTRPRGQPTFQLEGWDLITYEHHPEQTVMRMRLGNLPFFVLGCLVVFYWARRYFGTASGIIATCLLTLIPTVLAHAGLATTDMGLTACLGAAFVAMLVWAEEPTGKHGVVFGFCMALALLSKFTTLGFFPMGAGIGLGFYLAAERPGMEGLKQLVKERASSFAIAVGVCLFTVWAGYFFSFGKVPFWNVSLPAWEYFDGIRVALLHNTEGHPAWLLGEARRYGWWYYFPVALGVKTPLGLLVLVLVGMGVCWKNRRRVVYLMPLAFSTGILLPAMAGNVNIGVRHVLPVYLAFSVVASVGLVQLARLSNSRAWAGVVAVGLVLWVAAAGALHHPDYIPYFNELVRGQPDRVLCDSDYDWGQDIKRLAARLKQLGATQVNYGYVNSYDNSFLETYPGLPRIQNIHPLQPAEGWTAVCPTMDHATQYGLEYRYPNIQPWYAYLPVKERVGTIDLLYLAPGSLDGKK